MRRLFFLSLILLWCVAAMAQESGKKVSKEHSNVKGGVRIGLTTSQISGDDLTGFHQFGGYAGLYVTFPLTQNWKWMSQPELNFNMKGSHTYFPKGLKEGQRTYSLSLYYLEVPVLIRWNCYKGLILELGPSFNVNVFHREKFDGDADPHVQPFRRFEFAALVGANYLFKDHYGIFFRFTSSLVPVRVPNNVTNRLISKQFNDALMIGFYYQF